MFAAKNNALEDTRLFRTPPAVLSEGWSAETASGRIALAEVSRPAAGCVGKTLRLTRTLPVRLPGDASLCFQTKNESVRVFVDGDLVYTYGETPQRVYGHGVGATWMIAPLPEGAGGKILMVELVPIGERTGYAPYQFLLGSRGDIIAELSRNSFPLAVVTLLLALIGTVGLALALRWTLQYDRRAAAAFNFSLFVLLATVWMASDSGLMQFLLRNKGVSYMLFGCSFYLLCVPLALFMAAMQPERKRLYRGFSIGISAYAALRILLYMAGLVNFETALWLLHLMMGALILSINLTLWIPVLRTKAFAQPGLCIAMSAFTVIEGISLISFYAGDKLNRLRNGYSSGFYIGILLFALIFVASVLHRAQQLRQQAFKAAFLERRAYTDELTGLLNAKGFDDKCAEIMHSAPAERCLAVLDFDVNFFSQYNATNGLPAGDDLLKRIAGTLAAHCRPDELCARQEADHFVCLLSDDSFATILARIREADQTARAHMTARMLLLSYGVVEVTDRSLHAPALRYQAAVAKRTIKGNYENNIAVYDQALHALQLQEVVWLSGFEEALDNNEYVIFLQPKIDIVTERIGGAEALVRRIEPDGSVTPAGPIIEALERKGFVTKLDYYVLTLVCAFLRRCLDEGRAVQPVSANFSRVHLYDPGFPARIAETVDGFCIPRSLIEIELTETAFLAGKDALRSTVQRLHEQGFAVSIDDFGSGYSSLNMLKDVDVDVIKLDREFLTDFAENRRAGTIIEHTLRLAQQMGITAVAEGIENEAQLAFLRRHGCQYVQGYYYSHPLPEDVFIERYFPLEQKAAEKPENGERNSPEQ